MGISSTIFQIRDVYIEYDFENVMFRYDHEKKKFFRKFYGEGYEDEINYNNHLLNDAIRFGEEIDERKYKTGKPGDDFQKSKID